MRSKDDDRRNAAGKDTVVLDTNEEKIKIVELARRRALKIVPVERYNVEVIDVAGFIEKVKQYLEIKISETML